MRLRNGHGTNTVPLSIVNEWADRIESAADGGQQWRCHECGHRSEPGDLQYVMCNECVRRLNAEPGDDAERLADYIEEEAEPEHAGCGDAVAVDRDWLLRIASRVRRLGKGAPGVPREVWVMQKGAWKDAWASLEDYWEWRKNNPSCQWYDRNGIDDDTPVPIKVPVHGAPERGECDDPSGYFEDCELHGRAHYMALHEEHLATIARLRREREDLTEEVATVRDSLERMRKARDAAIERAEKAEAKCIETGAGDRPWWTGPKDDQRAEWRGCRLTKRKSKPRAGIWSWTIIMPDGHTKAGGALGSSDFARWCAEGAARDYLETRDEDERSENPVVRSDGNRVVRTSGKSGGMVSQESGASQRGEPEVDPVTKALENAWRYHKPGDISTGAIINAIAALRDEVRRGE